VGNQPHRVSANTSSNPLRVRGAVLLRLCFAPEGTPFCTVISFAVSAGDVTGSELAAVPFWGKATTPRVKMVAMRAVLKNLVNE